MVDNLFRFEGVSVVSTKPGVFEQFTLALLPNNTEKSIAFDMTESEQERHSWEIPEHPVAPGFVVADSRKKNPIDFTVSGVFSATPLGILSTLTSAFGSLRRVDIQSYEALLKLAEQNPKVYVVTEEKVIPNMSIVSVERIKDPDGGHMVAVNVTFREIRTAFGSLVEAAVDHDATAFGAAGGVAGGQQTAESLPIGVALSGGLGNIP